MAPRSGAGREARVLPADPQAQPGTDSPSPAQLFWQCRQKSPAVVSAAHGSLGGQKRESHLTGNRATSLCFSLFGCEKRAIKLLFKIVVRIKLDGRCQRSVNGYDFINTKVETTQNLTFWRQTPLLGFPLEAFCFLPLWEAEYIQKGAQTTEGFHSSF